MQESQQKRQDSGKKRKKPEYIYGNYPFYYGYRVGRALEEDPRVSIFRREWIENRDCLDIGCNEGHVTIALAVKFCCKTMVGMDIDSDLIYKARCNLKREVEELEKEKGKEAERGVAAQEDSQRNADEKCVEEMGTRIETQDAGGGAAMRNGGELGAHEKESHTGFTDERGFQEKGNGKVSPAGEKDGVKHDNMAAVESYQKGSILKEIRMEEIRTVSVTTQGMDSVTHGDENGATEKGIRDSDDVEEKEKLETNGVEAYAKENGEQKGIVDVKEIGRGSQVVDSKRPSLKENGHSGKAQGTDSGEAAGDQNVDKCAEKSRKTSRRKFRVTDSVTGDCVLSGPELSTRVTFRTHNYLDAYAKPGTYDTILCLSISKWIHLNWGDEGLLKFFAKIFKELRPGGCLVLEPQPWESYSKKRRVSEVARKNFQGIKLRPDNFPSILTDKIGFKFYEQISSQLPSDKSGFRRPLFVYHK